MSAIRRSYRLRALLRHTGHRSQPFGSRGAVQVFCTGDWRYYRLSDYVVTSAVSGPSIVLVPEVAS